MGEIAARYERVADQFSDRVHAVPSDAWDNATPCDGWVARDVVAHLAEWVPAFFFERWQLDADPPPADDPVAAWDALNAAIRSGLDDPEVAGREADTPMGSQSFEAAVDMIVTGDVLVHTWDLARATGLDETLDPEEVHRMLSGMEGMGDTLEASGHYGPRVPVPADADEQTQLLAFTGRRP